MAENYVKCSKFTDIYHKFSQTSLTTRTDNSHRKYYPPRNGTTLSMGDESQRKNVLSGPSVPVTTRALEIGGYLPLLRQLGKTPNRATVRSTGIIPDYKIKFTEMHLKLEKQISRDLSF